MDIIGVYARKLANFTSSGRIPSFRKRSYSAAQVNRLTASWITRIHTEDSELRQRLRTMRARSRELAQNNDHAVKFSNMVVNNVIGPKGIKTQNKGYLQSGDELDTENNQIIERKFQEWANKRNASVNGKLSWLGIQRLAMRTVAIDGEVLIRRVKGAANPFSYSLQIIEADHLDEDYNMDLPNGNRIIMGIEVDQWRKPVYYHLLTKHPGDYSYVDYSGKVYDKVPAEEIIHLFIPLRDTQSRGVPWAHSAMLRMNMLGGYEEAELVAARAASCKMGFIETPTGTEYTGDDDDDGDVITEAEPGIMEQLPAGAKFSAYNPDHPNSGFKDFVKAVLRGISCGLNVSYNSFNTDLENVNYSSIRFGMIEERDHWRALQTWVCENLCEIVYEDWYEMAFLAGQLPFTVKDKNRLNRPVFQPRGWSWIDPDKEHKANATAINNGLDTRTRILADQGMDFEDVVKQLAEEDKIIQKHGLKLNDKNQVMSFKLAEESSDD